MRRKVRGVQANGRDDFFEKAGEKGECDGLKNGPLRYAEKWRVGISWHQLEIMMNGCDWRKVGLGISRRGISRMPSLCCNVLDRRIRRTAPLRENLMSLRVRCFDGLKARPEDVVRLDFLRKEKKATKNRHQRAACVGMDKSNTVLMRRSKLTVIGCFWRDFVPMTRLRPFLVRATGKLFKTSHAKP